MNDDPPPPQPPPTAKQMLEGDAGDEAQVEALKHVITIAVKSAFNLYRVHSGGDGVMVASGPGFHFAALT